MNDILLEAAQSQGGSEVEKIAYADLVEFYNRASQMNTGYIMRPNGDGTYTHTFWNMNPDAYKILAWDNNIVAIRSAYRKLGRGRNVAKMKDWWFTGALKAI